MDSQKGHVFLLSLVEWLKWFEIHLVVIACFLGFLLIHTVTRFFLLSPELLVIMGNSHKAVHEP